MAEIFNLPEENNNQENPKLEPMEVYEHLDDDPELALLLGKEIHEETGPVGELIWPSNMIDFKDDSVIIDGMEFNEMIEENIASIKKDTNKDTNDEMRILKIQQLINKKSEVIQRIKEVLRELGFKKIEIINE